MSHSTAHCQCKNAFAQRQLGARPACFTACARASQTSCGRSALGLPSIPSRHRSDTCTFALPSSLCTTHTRCVAPVHRFITCQGEFDGGRAALGKHRRHRRGARVGHGRGRAEPPNSYAFTRCITKKVLRRTHELINNGSVARGTLLVTMARVVLIILGVRPPTEPWADADACADRMAACRNARQPSVASTGIAGCTSACDQIEAGTAEYVPCGQV
jgi:hypothetical protein